MKRTNIYLDENLDRLLRYIALEQGRSFTDLAREALTDYAKRQGFPDPSRIVAPLKQNRASREELEEALSRIHASVETDLTPDEIEDLITSVSDEMREERIAQRLATHD
ncbi:MAG TPA: ribbon-helix-helix protein, CopG family [Thermomicrobiales bacterium]|nr:ribbon-helix-helix protein, CopG family [Thermomicrobiales bacterium]